MKLFAMGCGHQGGPGEGNSLFKLGIAQAAGGTAEALAAALPEAGRADAAAVVQAARELQCSAPRVKRPRPEVEAELTALRNRQEELEAELKATT